ncbi:lysosomal-trafficking regulator-like isoform X3 [Brevipalpus obovatus]|uniref:lysosomal-trafficking regulator-like isoform X3 n=1 Tax=Brevipalpus obovatus TaxID=246614 RepID=UPI003D9F4A2C
MNHNNSNNHHNTKSNNNIGNTIINSRTLDDDSEAREYDDFREIILKRLRNTPLVNDDMGEVTINEKDLFNKLREQILQLCVNSKESPESAIGHNCSGDEETLISVFKMLLNSSLSLTEQDFEKFFLNMDFINNKIEDKTHKCSVSGVFTSNTVDLSSTSDIDESESESLVVSSESCYEADDECCEGEREGTKVTMVNRSTEKKFPPQQCKKYNHIHYPQLCRLAVDLLLSITKENSNYVPRRIISLVLNTLLKYCRDSPKNREIMQKNDLPFTILDGFKSILMRDQEELRPIQTVILDLFLELTSNNIQGRELKLLFSLFKNKSSPIDLLINSLTKMVNNQKGNPTHYLTFSTHPSNTLPNPISLPQASSSLYQNSRLSLLPTAPSSPNRNTFESTPDSLLWVHENRREARSDTLSTGWSEAALCLPLPQGKNSSLFKNRKFSLSLWLSVERLKVHTGFGPYRKPFSYPKPKSSTGYLHILSIALDRTLIEVWLDPEQRMIIIRTLRISSPGRPRIIAQVCSPCHLSFSGTWHHICFNFEELKSHQFNEAALLVHYIVDGSRMETVAVNHGCPTISTKTCILLGSSSGGPPFHSAPSTSAILSPYSSSSSPHIILRTGNMVLFKRELSIKHCLYLYAMGPDFASFRLSQIPELEAKLDTLRISKHLNLSKFLLDSFLKLSPSSCFQDLQEAIFIIFKPSFKNHYLIYTPVPTETSFIPFGTRSSSINEGSGTIALQVNRAHIISFAKVEYNTENSFNTALVNIGGIGVLIFFFAKMVEITSNEDVQAKALEIVLRMCEAHFEFLLSFCYEFAGFKLINSILETPDCSISKKIFYKYLCFCLSGLNMKDAVIIDSSAFSYLISAWRAWHRKPDTVESFISILKDLISPNNIHRNFNLIQMRKAHIADILLTMVKDTLVQTDNTNQKLPLEVANSLPHITQLLICCSSSLDLSILNDVFDTLLLLHQAANTYMCHSKSSFYYLFSSNWKSSSLNFKTNKIVSCVNGGPPTNHTSSSSHAFAPPLKTSSRTLLNIVISGFIDTISNIVEEAPSSILDKIIGPIVKPSFLVVMAHNEDSQVRESILRCLFLCLRRGRNLDSINQFVSRHGVHLIANQLHQHLATQNLVTMTFGYLLNTDHNISPQPITFEASCDLTEIFKMGNEHFNNFVILFALLPNSVGDHNLCHNSLNSLRKILEDIPNSSSVFKHLHEIGLIECLAKVLVFAEKIKEAHSNETDIDGYEEDVITSDVYKILHVISRSLYDSSGSQNWSLFVQIVGILQTLEKRAVGPFQTCVREALVVYLESALDSIGFHITELIKPREDKSRLIRALNKSEKFFNLFSSPDESFMIAGNTPGYRGEYSSMSTYSSFRSIVDSSSEMESMKENRISLSNSEMSDRFKKFILKSVDFLLMRNKDLPLSEREKFFSRTLTHRLFQILDLSHKGPSARWRKPMLNSFIGSSKETIKNEVCRLILYLLSPVHTLSERRYYVSFFRGNVESLLLLLRGSARFARYFVSFMKDLVESCGENDAQRILQELLNFNSSRNVSIRRPRDDELVKLEIGEWLTEWSKERENLINGHQDEAFLERLRPLSHKVAESGMSFTREAVEAQNSERKVFINHLKHLSTERYSIHKNWKSIIEMFSHERSVWYYSDTYMHSWELDPTEGPMRIRRRLRRCNLNIPDRFFCKDAPGQVKCVSRNLAFLFQKNIHESDINDLIDRLYTNERILYTTSCLIIVPAEEYPGEILIGSSCIHFVGEQKCLFSESSVFTEVWLFEEIKEIHQCRYQLQNNAFEMFLTSGSSYLISFGNKASCDEFLKILYMRTLTNLTQEKSLDAITQSWRDGYVTNFEYLTYLNKMAGRSFNDLMQYPVFPFILADYESDALNLNSPTSFRNLSKPMGVQKKSKEDYYVNQYNYLREEYKRAPKTAETLFPTTGPYHYGSHYSNSGTVLHFLVRLPPFTQMFLTYQDNNFDIPDRTFHALATSWRLASGDSTTDYKELIPEFYFLPEFLVNQEKFNFGTRQNGEVVSDVKLPNWCRNDPRLFILIHRQALESDYVSQTIHEWIDLIFGHKQTGKAAVEAINTFHPATYYGVDVSKIEDSVKRKALQTMIKTFGQMPKQLFSNAHPAINWNRRSQTAAPNRASAQGVLREVNGLKWGSYVGSPDELDPLIIFREKCPRKIDSFASLLTNDVFSLEPCTCLLLTYNRPKSISSNAPTNAHITSSALVSWDHPDNVIRIKFSRSGSASPLISGNSNLDKIMLCATSPGRPSLLIGYRSGLIAVYNFAGPLKNKSELRGCKSWLHGHHKPVTCITINQEFNVIISGGQDGACIMWDLNRLFYVRTIVEHPSDVKTIAISPTLGDIASLSDHEGISNLKVHTINGARIGEISSKEKITALCYSFSPEGISVNTLVVGYADGKIRMLSSWDLSFIRVLRAPQYTLPIKCMTFTHDNQLLHVANEEGSVVVWGKVNTKKPTNLINLFLQSDPSS